MELQLLTRASKLKIVADSIDHDFDFKFSANDEGLVLNMLDDAQVWFFQIRLTPSFFESYRCEGDIAFAVNSTQLKTTLRSISADDEVEIAFSEANQIFHINSAGPGGSHKRFAELRPVTPPAEALQVPDAEYPAQVELQPKLLGAVLRDMMGLAAVHVAALAVAPSGLAITARGDGRSLEHRLAASGAGGTHVIMESNNPLVVHFQTSLLLRAVKSLENCECVELSVRERFPLKLLCRLSPDGSSYVMHYVLPQLE